MRRAFARFSLVAVILILAAGNVALFAVLRDYYVLSKQLPAEPHNIGRFAAANASIDRSVPRVVLFGDSRVARWSPPPDPGSTASIVNRGISAETTEQMRLRFDADVLGLEPTVVVIQAGINDLVAAGLSEPGARRRIVERCIENLSHFARRASAAGSHVLLLEIGEPAAVPLLRRPFWDDSIPALVEEVNAGLASLGNGDDIIVASLAPALKDETGEWRVGFAADTLHYTADGYAAINRLVSPLLENLLADAVQ